jgi:hypothetical protein
MQPRNDTRPQNLGSQPKLSSPGAPAAQPLDQGQVHHAQHIPVTQTVTFHPSPLQPHSKNQNGLAPVPENPTLATSTNVAEAQGTPYKTDATSAGAVSGAVEDDSEKEAKTLAKENERTKMSFLLN